MINIEALFGPLTVTASLVVDHYGNTKGSDGTSKSLGGVVDLELLKAFRKNAGAVLTTGLTARTENYKLPSTADLFVLSRQDKQTLPLAIRSESVRVLGVSSDVTPKEAIESISALGYDRLHVEFGPQTLLELMSTYPGIRVFVSSDSADGAERFSEANLLTVKQARMIDYLYVTEVAGRA